MSYQSLDTIVGIQTTHSLPSRGRRQHDVLARVLPADGTNGATSCSTPRQRTPSDPKLQRGSPSCLSMSDRKRTAAAVALEPAVKISRLVLALYLLRRGCSSVYCSSTGCCGSACWCYYCCCCGRCSTTGRWWSTGNDPTDASVEQDCVSSGYWLCVLWTGCSCPTESRREELTENE